MIRNNASCVLAVATAVSLSTSVAAADPRRPERDSTMSRAQSSARVADARPLSSVVSESTEPVEVHEYFRRDLENGCEYRSTVRGVVHPVGSPSGDAGPALYSPRLRVSTGVHCPNVPATRTESVIRARAIRPEALVHQIQQRARVQTSGSQGTCSYTPSFQFDRSKLSGRDVNFTCRAREGGVFRGGVYVDPVDDELPEKE